MLVLMIELITSHILTIFIVRYRLLFSDAIVRVQVSCLLKQSIRTQYDLRNYWRLRDALLLARMWILHIGILCIYKVLQ